MNVMKLSRMALISGMTAAVAASPGWVAAATASTTFNVTANVVATCAVSASNVAFGTYGSSQLDGTGSISLTCTNLSPYTVELDAGAGSGATVATRKMSGPSGQTLNYSLYQDSSRSSLWGTQSGTHSVSGTGTGTAQSLTVYGRIPASQTPGVGSYTDTITVTVTY